MDDLQRLRWNWEQQNAALLRSCALWLMIIGVVLIYIAVVLTIVHKDVVLPAINDGWQAALFLLGLVLVLGAMFGVAFLLKWLIPLVIKAICLAPFWLWYRVLGMGKKRK
jgi:hypothetical protein